jgi:inhibitor of KinA
LDTDLSLSRKRSPRQNLAAGSVAIGGNQTGVYPSDSPGGWNILGKTPISMFDIKNKNPSLLKPGDQLRFKSISLATYLKIDSQIVNNSFKLISV